LLSCALYDISQDKDCLLLVLRGVVVVASCNFLDHIHDNFGLTLENEVHSLWCSGQVGQNPKSIRSNLEVGCQQHPLQRLQYIMLLNEFSLELILAVSQHLPNNLDAAHCLLNIVLVHQTYHEKLNVLSLQK